MEGYIEYLSNILTGLFILDLTIFAIFTVVAVVDITASFNSGNILNIKFIIISIISFLLLFIIPSKEVLEKTIYSEEDLRNLINFIEMIVDIFAKFSLSIYLLILGIIKVNEWRKNKR